MWTIDAVRIDDTTSRWARISASRVSLSFGEVFAAWQSDAEFRAQWIAGLRSVPFDAYAWECPPVTSDSASRTFECVFVRSPGLARMAPDAGAFSEHFSPGCAVATFDNLGGDAKLVAPCPRVAPSDYAHLARFVATAPPAQHDAFWQAVGAAMEIRLGATPVWLSTAGLGVAWLHIRLDDRPKYYRHAPYARS